jgi:hypothetical protein
MNHRGDQRHKAGVLAALMTAEDKFICFGALEDISAGGARLKLISDTELPKNFVIVLSSKHGPRRNCSVVWQKATMVGVRFSSNDEQAQT